MVDAAVRETFRQIVENDYAIPDSLDPGEFILSSIPLLGDPDGEFRERHVYGTLYRWVLSETIETEALRAFHLALLEEDALFSGIGTCGSDTAFLRAFSVLMLVPTVYYHRTFPYLSSDDLLLTERALARYLREEVDLRGYVSEKKWWAHGIAHAADAVGQLVQCDDLELDAAVDLLSAIAQAMTPNFAVFAHEEDARMAAAVLKLLQRETTPVDAVAVFLQAVVPDARFNGVLPGVHLRYVNARNFLRCLLFGAEGVLAEPLLSLLKNAHDALPDR